MIGTALAAGAVFAGGAAYYSRLAEADADMPSPGESNLIRPHSPMVGPPEARVTIVEFFDPSCEACRAFYPIVKQIMGEYPKDTRLVLRYAALHAGSDEAVRILEAARLQDKVPGGPGGALVPAA